MIPHVDDQHARFGRSDVTHLGEGCLHAVIIHRYALQKLRIGAAGTDGPKVLLINGSRLFHFFGGFFDDLSIHEGFLLAVKSHNAGKDIVTRLQSKGNGELLVSYTDLTCATGCDMLKCVELQESEQGRAWYGQGFSSARRRHDAGLDLASTGRFFCSHGHRAAVPAAL